MSGAVDLQAWSIDLEDRYCMYQVEADEFDRARLAMQATIHEPIELTIAEGRPDHVGQRVEYRGVYIGDIWPPDDFLGEEGWSNYPAPIIRVDDETPITAGYSFDGGKDEAEAWFVERLRKIQRGEWKRGDGR